MILEEADLPWKWGTTVERQAKGRAAIMDSLPVCQPLPLQALGETPTRVSAPQSDSASCQSLPPRALEGDPIRASMGSPIVAALSLSGWSWTGQRHKWTFLQRRHTDSQQTRKDAQHCSLLEKCKPKLEWGITSHQSEWPSSKHLQTIHAGEGVKKREPSCTIGGNINWYSHYGE